MFSLDHVVPWGRSLAEYQAMFALSVADLEQRVLGCADGPASFNAEATARGARIVSCDPLYQCSRTQIQERIEATSANVLEQTRANAEEFVWNAIPSIEALALMRSTAMQAFLDDYEPGLREGRYVPASLPALAFADRSFDIALCSHFLFLYSDLFDADFHVAAARELCRIAADVRIFPLLALGSRPSPHVDAVRRALSGAGLAINIEPVPYEFQRGGNHMLRIRRRSTRS